MEQKVQHNGRIAYGRVGQRTYCCNEDDEMHQHYMSTVTPQDETHWKVTH